MSLTQQAARGALWTIASSIGGRAIGVLGTLVITRFITPDVIGEVSTATIICMTANWLTVWGFGQYAVVHGRGADAAEVTWHATFSYAVLGVLGLGAAALVGGRLALLLDAPTAGQFIPGLALALFIRRLGAMPERVLNRAMNFRASGIAMTIGEATYTAVTLSLAWRGYGGMAVVYGNIVQSVVMTAVLIRAAGWRTWATPTPLRLARFREMLRYGAPLALQGVAHNASRYWDNLAVNKLFGDAATGVYNMAYNLADIPAIQVGEQLATVLMPSMSALPPERRPQALERSSALLSLILFPMAVGLGLVAGPLIEVILPADRWQQVGPLLTVLAGLSVFRPITWVLSAYMEAQSRTGRLMYLELAKIVVLLGGLILLAPFGLQIAAAAVGLAFGATAVAGVLLVAREGPSVWRMFLGFAQPLTACAVMAVAVIALRHGLTSVGVTSPPIRLVASILVGAAAYVASALVVCRATVRDLLAIARGALRRGDDP